MFKNALREIIIILLILLAIILLLAVLLYKYIPSNKIIPEEITYVTSEPIKEELANMDVSTETDFIMSYELTASDMNNYKRIDSYVPGKVNPFSTYEEETPNGEEQNGTTNVNSPNTNTNTQKGNTSTGNTFYNNTGTK